jgi:ubiquinone/menaquinone biosynthesis C-methylase UbiE
LCDSAGQFEKVIAQDGSEQQLQHADRQYANVEYQQADAHSTGLPDHCADLVTVAQALHW